MDKVDIAVVGAGVAGAYAAYRVKTQWPDKRVAILEASGRVGGRLWSEEDPDVPGVMLELGGETFAAPHRRVMALVDALGLQKTPLATESMYYAAYLRGCRLTPDDLAAARSLPYRLPKDEQGKTVQTLFADALLAALPGLAPYFPLKADMLDQAVAYLRSAKVDGKPLSDHAFWPMISAHMSDEAFALVRDATAHPTMLSAGNAYNLTLHFLASACGPTYRLTRGYQALPVALVDRAVRAGADLRLGHRLTAIDHRSNGAAALHVDTQHGAETLEADTVILALPAAALPALAVTGASGRPLRWPDGLNAILGFPADKFFLLYPEPWWQDIPNGPGQIHPASYAIHTATLPLCSCIYWGAAHYGDSGPSVVLGSYGDGGATHFWASQSPKTTEAELGHPVWPDSLSKVEAPDDMLARLHSQIETMHGTALPKPTKGYFQNWAQPPYGAGYHGWRPFVRSADMAAALRHPFVDMPVYLGGEAYSDLQGWVEGALWDMDRMLDAAMGLAPPLGGE